MTGQPLAAGTLVRDASAALALAGGDAALAAELAALFRTQVLPEAEQLAGLGDPAARGALAHKVRGAALAIGAAEIAALSRVIEDGAPFAGSLSQSWSEALARLRHVLD